MPSTFTFKVEINEKGDVVAVEPPAGETLNCTALEEYSEGGLAKKAKFKKKRDVVIGLWALDDDDPCVKHGGLLWCW